MKLFYLPHAGGCEKQYLPWSDLIADVVQIVPIAYHGQNKFDLSERALDVETLLDRVQAQIDPWVNEPFALFGHSMGGIVAAQILSRLIQRGQTYHLVHIFLSGCAPSVAPMRVSTYSEDAFWTYLKKLGQINDKIFDNLEYRRFFGPFIRADLVLSETLAARNLSTVPDPLAASVLIGSSDPTTPIVQAKKWLTFLPNATLHTLPGDHFFPFNHADKVASLISSSLRDSVCPNRSH